MSKSKPFTSIDEARDYVMKRWGDHFKQSDGVATPNESPGTVPYRDKRGPKIKRWQLKAFTEIDDLIRIDKLPTATAINDTCYKYAQLGHSHKIDSFVSMYYQFKSNDEFEKRKAALGAAIIDGDLDEATEQCFRLSFIVDIRTFTWANK